MTLAITWVVSEGVMKLFVHMQVVANEQWASMGYTEDHSLSSRLFGKNWGFPSRNPQTGAQRQVIKYIGQLLEDSSSGTEALQAGSEINSATKY